MAARLVLFDIDGTLLDAGGAGRSAMERAFLDVFGTDSIGERAAGVRFAGMTDPVIFRAVARAIGVSELAFAAREADVYRGFLFALREEMARPDPRRRVLPGVRPLLDALTERADVHLGLLTGNLEAGAAIKLGALGLDHYFSGGGFSSDHQDRREIARAAHRKLSAGSGIEFPPSRVTVVGDTEHDVDCAVANGFRAVAVDSGWVDRERLESAGPDRLLDGLDDLDRSLEAIGLSLS